MNPVKSIFPVSDTRAAQMISDSAFADLAEQITATPVPHGAPARTTPARRRRWLIAIPVAAGLAAAALVAGLGAQPGPHAPAAHQGPFTARTLSFIRHGSYIDVIVRDPVADPRRYRAEFAAHGLHVTLQLIPASPSAVGSAWFYKETQAGIAPIPAKGKCRISPGWTGCPIGFRVPLHYRGQAQLVLGRPARPGEQYEAVGSVTAPGEVLHGLRYKGKRVAVVLAMMRRRHATARLQDGRVTATIIQGGAVPVRGMWSAPMTPAQLQQAAFGRILPASKVPGTWFVYSATPWAPQQVILAVGPTRAPPRPRVVAPLTPGPSPSSRPSPSPSP